MSYGSADKNGTDKPCISLLWEGHTNLHELSAWGFTKRWTPNFSQSFWKWHFKENQSKEGLVWGCVQVLHMSQSLWFPWMLKAGQRWICSCMWEREKITFFPSSASHPSPTYAEKRLYHRLPRQQIWWQTREVLQETLAATIEVPQGPGLPEAGASLWGSIRAGPGSQARPTTPARSGAARRHQGSPSPRHRAPPVEWAKPPWACGWAWLGRAHDQAGQGCEELETSPALASLEQGVSAAS